MTQPNAPVLDERLAEIRRAQSIIDGLKAFREYCLTKAVSADEIGVMLAEQWPDVEGRDYVAVKIAEAAKHPSLIAESGSGAKP